MIINGMIISQTYNLTRFSLTSSWHCRRPRAVLTLLTVITPDRARAIVSINRQFIAGTKI